jgi:hypothetical protein
MHEMRRGGGPNRGLLLLIPAALILANVAKHRRQAMWESADGEAGAAGGPRGHHGRFAQRGWSGGRDGFRLPPKIESALDAWHTRAHQEIGSTESTESTTI